jgi:hypothetical protein
MYACFRPFLSVDRGRRVVIDLLWLDGTEKLSRQCAVPENSKFSRNVGSRAVAADCDAVFLHPRFLFAESQQRRMRPCVIGIDHSDAQRPGQCHTKLVQ